MSSTILPNAPALDDILYEGRAELKKQAEACTAENTRLREWLDQHREQVEASHAIDVESKLFLDHVALNHSADFQVQLLQGIVKFRKTIWAEYIATLREALAEETDASYTAWQNAEVKAKTDLTGLGYLDLPPSAREPSKITPGMIASHPEVVATRAHHSTMRGRQSTFNLPLENREAITGLLQMLVAVRESHNKGAAIPANLPDGPGGFSSKERAAAVQRAATGRGAPAA